MRIRSGLLLLLALVLVLAACDGADGPKVGVVDLNRLMRESVPGKAGLKFIETQQAELQGQLDALQEKLEKNPGDEKVVQELQKVYASSQQRIQAEGQNVVGTLFDSIQRVLDEFRAKNGYSMLIRQEALESFDQALDVTNQIMAEVDKLKLEFKPVIQPEADKPEPNQQVAPEQSQTAPAKAPAGTEKQEESKK